MTEPLLTRRVWGEVDLGALAGNVARLCELAAPAQLLAVVKANGYGHGAYEAARTAVDAGARWLGVATVWEGVELSQKHPRLGAPILVLSEPTNSVAAEAVVTRGLTPVVYTLPGIEMLAKAVVDVGARDPLPVHLKVDTGMHRVGCTPTDALALAETIAARDELDLEGVCTHFAVADEPDNPYTAGQIARFDEVVAALETRGLRPRLVHAANSAGLLVFPEARYDLVRVGIALYGVPPAPALADRMALEPVLTIKARVSHVKELDAGARVSYGLRYELAAPARVATVPVGYADGVPRNLGLRGGEVLIGGRRHPIAGTVTMDQLLVDAGDAPVEVGDEVVLIGRQGDEQISAGDWAERLDTIAYEIVCGIGSRVPRRYR
ncbi:MAG TPA: alanine racemase [Acidimicrobiia bacterium]